MTTDAQQLGGGDGGSSAEAQAEIERQQREAREAEAAAAGAVDDDEPRGKRKAPPPQILMARPEETHGVYIVLWASVVNPDERDEREQPVKPKFREVAYVKADTPMRAKGALLDSPDFSWLREKASEDRGILLYAVAAFYWPFDTAPTTFFQPPPELKIG